MHFHFVVLVNLVKGSSLQRNVVSRQYRIFP